MSVRTRFAPSPTGALHLGNVRVAVFNWLFARRHGGAFVLRLEDTDVDRNRPEAEAGIMGDLRWLDLEWDEGPDRDGPHGPYRQSERGPLYREAADRLLGAGRAYRCYCTPEELGREAREVQGGEEVLRYSGRCRSLSAEERRVFEEDGRSWTVRFAVPEGSIDVKDEIRGVISFSNNDFADFIILRQDGRPTYNFAVVVDDALMAITHVIRGAGHLSNTPRQALLFDALQVPRPRFAHLPMVLDEDRRKLSKREASAAVSQLHERGFHPEGVVNYLSLLGWSHPEEKEILSRDELIRTVDLHRMGAGATVFDEEKLRWVSGQHIAAMDLEALARAVEPFLDRERYPIKGEALLEAVAALRSRLQTFSDINQHLHFLFPEEGSALEEARREVRADPESRRVLEAAAEKLEGLADWGAPSLDQAVREVGRECGVRGARLFHPIRKAVTGEPSGPELGRILAAVGRDETLSRIRLTLGREGA